MNARVEEDRVQVPAEVRRLLGELFDENKKSGQPVVQDRDLDQGREWLLRILIDTLLRMAHVGELCRLYQGQFQPPRPRRDWPDSGRPEGPVPDPAFPYHDLLGEGEALAVSEWGVNELNGLELGRLLLNPIALYDLADLIDATLPEWWMERMVEHGRALRDRAARFRRIRWNASVAVSDKMEMDLPALFPAISCSGLCNPKAADTLVVEHGSAWAKDSIPALFVRGCLGQTV